MAHLSRTVTAAVFAILLLGPLGIVQGQGRGVPRQGGGAAADDAKAAERPDRRVDRRSQRWWPRPLPDVADGGGAGQEACDVGRVHPDPLDRRPTGAEPATADTTIISNVLLENAAGKIK